MPESAFGCFIRTLRIGSGDTLRGFCERYGFDTAYISRLENNKLKPPSKEKLISLASALGLKQNSVDWIKFFDLAHQCRNELPPDIISGAPEVISRLPSFLRTPDGKKISEDKINKLINFLEKRGEE